MKKNFLAIFVKFMDQNKTILTDEEKAGFNKFVQELKEAVESEDKNKINQAMQDLNEFASPLAQKAMDKVIKAALKGTKLP